MYSELTEYMQERCRLDVYYPEDTKDFATVVWFHGGGLKGGNRSVPKALQEQGLAVVAVDYRLHPKVQSPAYIEDADGNQQPDWVQYAGMETRFAVAQVTGRVLFDLAAGRLAPEVPASMDAATTEKLRTVRAALIDMVERYRSSLA